MADKPNIYDIILLLFFENNKQFKGKTNIHKNLYLTKEILEKKDIKVPFNFKPYFYGPYSIQVSSALDLLENSGLIESNIETVHNSNKIEIKRTDYNLTDTGEIAVQNALDRCQEFMCGLRECFRLIRDTGSHEDTQVLATAAKIYLIIKHEEKPLTVDYIKKKAKDLGWKLRNDVIDASIKVLKETGLAKTAS